MNFDVSTPAHDKSDRTNQDRKSDMSARGRRAFSWGRGRHFGIAVIGAFSVCAAAMTSVGCSEDDPGTTLAPDVKPSGSDAGKADTGTSTTTPDATANADTGSTADTGSGDTGTTTTDSGGSSDTGATDASDAGVQGFCAGQTGLAFCSDFDKAIVPDASDLGLGWDQIFGAGTTVTMSTARAVSAPTSAFFQMATGGPGDAKAIRTVAAAVSTATLEYDFYLEALPLNGGAGFIEDWQFSDTDKDPNNHDGDRFGFRISAFATNDAAQKLDHANVEHNTQATGGGDDINPITLHDNAWNHIKFVAAFSTPSVGVNKVSFQAYIDRAATPVVDKTYDAPFAKAPFVRIAQGVVAPFNGDRRDWKLNVDNVTLKTTP